MKKWSAAVFLTAVVGVFAGSGYACCSSIGLFDNDVITPEADKTVTVLNGNAAAGSVTGGGKFNHGEYITLTATPNDGYKFVGWYDQNGNFVSRLATYSFNANTNATYYARFVETAAQVDKYIVMIDSQDVDGEMAGFVNGAGEYEKDTVITLTATSFFGYHFVGWYDGENEISDNATYQYTVTEAKTLTAKWAKNSYTISATKNLVGEAEGLSADDIKASVDGSDVYKHGEEVDLTTDTVQLNDSRYEFLGWFDTDTNVRVSTEKNFTFSATAQKTYEARWTAKEVTKYSVVINENMTDAGTVLGAGSFPENSTASLIATPNEGYEFLGWYIDGESDPVSTDQEYSFEITGDVTLTAKWAKKQYAITIDQNLQDAGAVSGASTYEHDATVTLVAVPNEGYTFEGWYDAEDKLISSDLTYSFEAKSSAAITAKWAINDYEVVVNKSHGTAGDITGDTTYKYGSTATLTATENAGYRFLGWYEGETLKSASETYSFTVRADVTLEARWEITGYSVTVNKSSDAAGTISGDGVYEIGQEVTLTATTNTGYNFLGWYDGVSLLSTELTYTFTPSGNTTITAKWELSEDAVFDVEKLDMSSITGYQATLAAQIGSRQDIPIVYVKYDGQYLRAFPWVSTGGVNVPVGSRGTKFLVELPQEYIIDYYIDVGGPQKIATTMVSVSDNSGPTFKLPASANGMLVYKDQEITLPDWTATDPSGVQGGEKDGVTVAVTYNGQNVAINGDKFTPTQFGNYTVTYTAKDNSENQNVGTVSFTIECKRMVEICDFDSEDVTAGYGYTNSASTEGELSTEFRYGSEGTSLKLTGIGTGADGLIKAYGIPNFYDLSGFDEIALYVWSDQDLTSVSTGLYLLNNEANSQLPINLKAGENIIRFSKEDFAEDYPNNQVISNGIPIRYRNEDYVWFQLRAPAGCNIYIDNLVGIFNDYSGTDNVNPIVDLGAAPLRAATTDKTGALYAGSYGDITCWTGETLDTAIARVLHGYDNSGEQVSLDYVVTTSAGADITAQVKAGTYVGAEGTRYNIRAWAFDPSGNKSTEKTATILVRNKPIEHSMEGNEKRTLSLFNQEDLVAITDQDFATLSMDYKVNKNGRVKLKTYEQLGDVYLNLKMPDGTYLTNDLINGMKYINVSIFTYNTGAEMYVGNTLVTRLKAGRNNFAFDAKLLLQEGAYNADTGMAKLQVFSPLSNSIELIFESAAAIYAQGTAPGEEMLPPLSNPVVTINGDTGLASWEAVANATGYIYQINNGAEIEVGADVLSVQLSDGDEFKVRAKGDGVIYSDSAMTANQLYLDGADLLHSCENVGYGIFEVNEAVNTITMSTEHVKQGSKSVKVVFTNAGFFVPCLTKGNNAVNMEDLSKYEYIEFNVYSDTAGIFLLCGSGTSGKATIVPDSTLVQGDNTIRISIDYLLTQIALDGDEAYNPEFGALTLHTSGACTLYFDKFVGKLNPNAGKTVLLSPRVTVDENGLATWTEVEHATGYAYRINGGEEVQVSTSVRSVQLSNYGDTIQVRTLGDGETYLDGVYSIAHEWLDPNAGEVMLNNCETVGGWVQAQNTPTLTTNNKFEGNYAVEVTSATDWWWMNVRISETSPTLAQLKATYETITLNIYSSYPGTATNTLYLGNGVKVATMLSQGDNVVTINTADLTDAMYVTDGDGYFINFFIGGACTIRIDNVVGVKGNASGDVGGGSGGSETPEDPETPVTPENPSVGSSVLNNCDSAEGFWCPTGAVVDTTTVAEGSGSVKMDFAGWSAMNIYLGTSDLSAYTHIKMSIYVTNTVKLLGGDLADSDPNNVLADLIAGQWNEVLIPVYRLAEFGLTAPFIAPYVNNVCTMYVDNIVGVNEGVLLNACESAEGFWCNSTATTNTTYVAEGNASVAMTFTGWSPMNVNWGTASITNYGAVKMHIYSTAAVKLLAGDINFNTDPDCILAELAEGWNEVTIPVSKLIKYNLTAQLCAPYVSGACTLYFDNIVGISK